MVRSAIEIRGEVYAINRRRGDRPVHYLVACPPNIAVVADFCIDKDVVVLRTKSHKVARLIVRADKAGNNRVVDTRLGEIGKLVGELGRPLSNALGGKLQPKVLDLFKRSAEVERIDLVKRLQAEFLAVDDKLFPETQCHRSLA